MLQSATGLIGAFIGLIGALFATALLGFIGLALLNMAIARSRLSWDHPRGDERRAWMKRALGIALRRYAVLTSETASADDGIDLVYKLMKEYLEAYHVEVQFTPAEVRTLVAENRLSPTLAEVFDKLWTQAAVSPEDVNADDETEPETEATT